MHIYSCLLKNLLCLQWLSVRETSRTSLTALFLHCHWLLTPQSSSVAHRGRRPSTTASIWNLFASVTLVLTGSFVGLNGCCVWGAHCTLHTTHTACPALPVPHPPGRDLPSLVYSSWLWRFTALLQVIYSCNFECCWVLKCWSWQNKTFSDIS